MLLSQNLYNVLADPRNKLNKCLRSNLDELGDADDVEDQDDVGSMVDGALGEGRVLLGEVRPLDGGGRRVLLGEPPEVRP